MHLEACLMDQVLTVCWTFVLAGIVKIQLGEEVRIMFDLIIEWMFNVAIIVAIVCMTALAIYATIALIRMTKEELKK